MTDLQTKVSITGYKFSLTELEEFIEHSRRIDGIDQDADVHIETTVDESGYVTLYTATDL